MSSEEERNALKRQLAKLSKKYQQVGGRGRSVGWRIGVASGGGRMLLARASAGQAACRSAERRAAVTLPLSECPLALALPRRPQVTQQQAHTAGLVAGAAAAVAAQQDDSPEPPLPAGDTDSELEVGGWGGWVGG